MRNRFQFVAIAVACMLIGYFFGSGATSNPVRAQAGGRDSRYQISSYAYTKGGDGVHGAFVIDTQTGQVSHMGSGPFDNKWQGWGNPAR